MEIRSEYYEPKPEAREGMYHGFPCYPPYDRNIPTPPHHPGFCLVVVSMRSFRLKWTYYGGYGQNF